MFNSKWEGGSKSRVGRGRGEGRERVELADSQVEKAVSQSGGAGMETAVASPRWQEAEEAM